MRIALCADWFVVGMVMVLLLCIVAVSAGSVRLEASISGVGRVAEHSNCGFHPESVPRLGKYAVIVWLCLSVFWVGFAIIVVVVVASGMVFWLVVVMGGCAVLKWLCLIRLGFLSCMCLSVLSFSFRFDLCFPFTPPGTVQDTQERQAKKPSKAK